MNIKEKIEFVLGMADRPLAEHEFSTVVVGRCENGDINGREFVGCSQSALGRRLREMRTDGKVKSNRRAGKKFMEYELARVPLEAAGA